MKFIVGMSLLMTLLFGSDRECVCYASGYAYDYGTKEYYYSDVVVASKKFKWQGGSCLQTSTYAKNEWHDFFKSEVAQSYQYTLGVIHACGFSTEASETEGSVTKRSRKMKGKYRDKDFSMRHLWDFRISR